MTDKKLTDEKCKELLEYKAKVNCEMCDLKGKGSCITCTYSLIKQFLEIFNRLQAENKEWKKLVEIWEMQHQKEKIEIESLEKKLKNQIQKNRLVSKQTKAEAYKEFAEKLKEWFRKESEVYKLIDNLLKELVGEDK